MCPIYVRLCRPLPRRSTERGSRFVAPARSGGQPSPARGTSQSRPATAPLPLRSGRRGERSEVSRRRAGRAAWRTGSRRRGWWRRSWRRCARCGCRAVLGEMTSCAAISLLDRPRASERAARRPRVAVSPAGPSRRRPGGARPRRAPPRRRPVEPAGANLVAQLGRRVVGGRAPRDAAGARASTGRRRPRRGSGPAARSRCPRARAGSRIRRAARGVARRSRRAAQAPPTAAASAR